MDQFRLTLIKSRLDSASREMDARLRRSSFSSIVREAKDYSVGILDPRGEVISQAECIPMMTAAMSRALAGVEGKVDLSALTSDDALLLNDPFAGGQHLQDVYLFQPILFEGELVGFGGSCAHHVDLGGSSAGLAASATEIYQEGLRFPLSVFSVERDWNNPNGFVRNMIAANVRQDEAVVGDINAQFAASRVAVKRVQEICEEFGSADYLRASDLLKDYAERQMRAEIARIPDGTYRAEERYELAPWGGTYGTVRVSVSVKDTDIYVDFEGTDEQIEGNINCPLSSAFSAVQSAVQSFLQAPDLQYNQGCSRPIRMSAPYGSILNPRPPAAVRARLTPASRAYSAVYRALCEAIPERTVAQGYDTTSAITVSVLNDDGTYQTTVEVFGGGWGACEEHAGADALDNPISNCSNAPVEALEHDYSHFTIDEYSILRGSGGDGDQTGGRGTKRVYRASRDNVVVAGYSDRHELHAQGAMGASGGKSGGFHILRADGGHEQLPIVFQASLNEGDRFVMVTGGGGGYGKTRRQQAHDSDLAEAATC